MRCPNCGQEEGHYFSCPKYQGSIKLLSPEPSIEQRLQAAELIKWAANHDCKPLADCVVALITPLIPVPPAVVHAGALTPEERAQWEPNKVEPTIDCSGYGAKGPPEPVPEPQTDREAMDDSHARATERTCPYCKDKPVGTACGYCMGTGVAPVFEKEQLK